MAEIGIYRGDFARVMLERCPSIERYWMVDPWRHLSDWNKPANTDDRSFESIREAALAATEQFASRRLVLRGKTTEVIDQIPDGSLDAVYIDGDHTLRGICIDLIRMFDKVRDGGWIGGDDFVPSIWQHRTRYEPTLIFPFAVHFAEAKSVPIFALPFGQFLICKNSTGFAFVDLTGAFKSTELAPQLGWADSARRRLGETAAYWWNVLRSNRR